MAKVNYVECPSCHKDYYIDRILSEVLETNPKQNLKCPFCKQEFHLGKNGPKAGAASRTKCVRRSRHHHGLSLTSDRQRSISKREGATWRTPFAMSTHLRRFWTPKRVKASGTQALLSGPSVAGHRPPRPSRQ